MFDWNDDADSQMRQMRVAGLSAATIGLALGTTKNAVIGRLRKLGIPAPENVAYVDGRGGKKPEKPRNVFAVKRRAISPEEAAALARQLERRRLMVAQMGLPSDGLAAFGTSDVCPFPMWPDHRQPGDLSELIVCGRQMDPDRHYCADHCRLAYEPRQERRAA